MDQLEQAYYAIVTNINWSSDANNVAFIEEKRPLLLAIVLFAKLSQ
jgi:hypothetical protein